MVVVVLSDYAYVKGGAEKVALDTALLLAKRGIRTILFSAVGPIAETLREQQNLEVICVGQKDILQDSNRMRAAFQGLWNSKARRMFGKLLQTLDKEDTVIHIHSYRMALSSSVLKTAVEQGFRMIYHVHDYGIVCPNRGFFNYRKKRICNLVPMSLSCIRTNCDKRSYVHKIWRILQQCVQKYIIKIAEKSSCMIYISKFSAEIIKKYVKESHKEVLIHNPIYMYKKKRINVTKNNTFVFLGRLSPEKNPLLLAKVGKEMQIAIMFIGDGDCRNEIKAMYSNAQITGWKEKEEIVQYLERARCLIFPSVCYEGEPLAVLEAMAMGIPVIASDACAAKDNIVDGENGMLFKNSDENSLRDAIKKIMDDKVAADMGRKAYESFVNMNRGEEVYIESLLREYKDVLVKK